MAVRGAFLEHLKLTQHPETFPGLCHSKPPSRSPRFLLVVDEFVVDPSKREDGEFIRCAACATKKKFRKGSLAWYPEEAVLRVIGNECGDERRAEAREDYKRRNSLDVLNAYLSEHLPRVHQYALEARAFREVARHAQELSLQLRTTGPSVGQAILRATKGGDGRLSIFASELQEGALERPIVFAKPVGLDFLRTKFQPNRLVDEALIRLNQADRGAPSKARRWLTSHAARLDDLTAAYANLTTGLRKLDDARQQVAQVGVFLSRSNLTAIDSWSRAHGNGLRIEWGSVFVTFYGAPARGQKATITSLHPRWRLLGHPTAPL